MAEFENDIEQKIQLGGNSEQAKILDAPQQSLTGMQLDNDAERARKLETITEPVMTTIMRDVRIVWSKLKYVMYPMKMREEGAKELRNWDLWGPLILCLSLAVCLSMSASTDDTSMVFEIVFVIVWLGAAIVSINGQLLGGKISFFQSVCVLGYCIFPLNIAALVNTIIGHWTPLIVKVLIVAVAFAWATYSSVGFISSMVIEQRKILAVYPVCLFYLFLSWFILL